MRSKYASTRKRCSGVVHTLSVEVDDAGTWIETARCGRKMGNHMDRLVADVDVDVGTRMCKKCAQLA